MKQGREDEPAKEAGAKSEEDEFGQGDQDHQSPDVEENGGKLRVWVRFVLRPQDQVRPVKSFNSEKVLLRSYLEAPQESERIEMQMETIWVLLTWPVLSTMTN